MVRHFRHLGDEADALADKCADQALRGTVIAECPAHRIDPCSQRGIGDDPPAPNGFEQIALADHPVTMLDEKCKQIKGFGFKRNQLPTAAQLAACDVQPMLAKRQGQRVSPEILRALPKS